MSRNLGRVAVVLALVASGALAGVRPAGAAISTAAVCVNVRAGASGFGDIGDVGPAQRSDIECLALSGITSGTGPGTYTPRGLAFRDSMATFVAKLVDTANALELTPLNALPASGPDAFTDDEQSVHEANINRLAAAGIVRGKAPPAYGANGAGNEVTRGQMATFLVAAIDFMRPTKLAAGVDAFTDDNGHTHEANINKLAAIDIVDGTGETSYSPDERLSRTQMASFLVRAMAFLEAQRQIAPIPARTQSIVLSPSGNVTNGTDAVAGDEAAFTASQIAAGDVDITLLPCENVSSSGGTTAFADNAPDDGTADPGGDRVEADIVTVNGAGRPADTEAVSGATVTNGTITFALDSALVDCVVAVVWDDADADDKLDLDAANVPTEQFGRTGLVMFNPPPAPSGAMDEQVLWNEDGADRFVGCELGGPGGAGPAPEEGPNAASATDCFTFAYDSGDLFFLDADGAGLQSGTPLSLAEFEAALSGGDDVSGAYDANAAGQSTFRLVDEGPGAPTGGTASATDGHTVVVTFNEVPGVDSYRVYRHAVVGSAVCPAFTTSGGDPYVVAGSVTAASDTDGDTTVTFTDTGLFSSTKYCYVVTSLDEGDESGPSATFTVTTGADTSPPVAIDAELTTNAGAANVTNGDVIQLCFDEDMRDPQVDVVDTETIRLVDADGTVATLTQGGNATFRRGSAAIAVAAGTAAACAANRVLEIAVTSAVTPSTAGGNSTLDVPATIDQATNIQDIDDNQFQPAGDPDVVVDTEGAEPS